MTEERVLPVCEVSAELPCEREEDGVPDEIDAVVQPVQPAFGEAVSDRPAAEALGSELCSGHEPALPRGDRGRTCEAITGSVLGADEQPVQVL